MARTVRLAERAAKSNIPVLIEGESGVGKELMARAIQGSSERRGKPFVTVNCGALPETLVESILFGHEKGSFTGATEKHVGKFAEANGGTLFLDEIGELSLEAQVKLLRALQEGEIDPVGARRPVKVDVRLISATNQNLIELVKAGRFREDLFYRLNVFPVSIPPLRARACDVPDLARRFLARFCAEEGKRIRGLTAEALALLAAYDWPGNVRQLENAIFRAVVLADGDELTTAEFPQIAAQVEGFDVRIPPGPAAGRRRPRRGARCGRLTIDGPDPHALRLLNDRGDVRTLEDIEAEFDPLRARPLPRTDVASGAQARHRPLDSLPEDEGLRSRRRLDRRRSVAIDDFGPASTELLRRVPATAPKQRSERRARKGLMGFGQEMRASGVVAALPSPSPRSCRPAAPSRGGFALLPEPASLAVASPSPLIPALDAPRPDGLERRARRSGLGAFQRLADRRRLTALATPPPAPLVADPPPPSPPAVAVAPSERCPRLAAARASRRRAPPIPDRRRPLSPRRSTG